MDKIKMTTPLYFQTSPSIKCERGHSRKNPLLDSQNSKQRKVLSILPLRYACRFSELPLIYFPENPSLEFLIGVHPGKQPKLFFIPQAKKISLSPFPIL